MEPDTVASSSSAPAPMATDIDERRKKVLTDYRKRLLESREMEAKVKERAFSFRRVVLPSTTPKLPIDTSHHVFSPSHYSVLLGL